MKSPSPTLDKMSVVADPSAFDHRSGNPLERLIFNHRVFILIACALVTALLGWQATKLSLNASFEDTLPRSHPYIQNYLANKDSLGGFGSSVRIVVENPHGSIYDPRYLETLREINDIVFLIPGVDRSFMKSLWTPAVRWTQITEEGYRGGPVMPPDYDGSAPSRADLRRNVALAGITGSLVANDGRSSMLFVPLIDTDPATGEPLDYAAFSKALEEKVRAKESDGVRIYIIGFAKLAGDLIDSLLQVMAYFGIAATIAGIVIYAYTRCIRSTVLVLACSLVAVLWQLGVVHLLGYVVNPYSMLVPFLVFAIGVSHGAQKMNGIMQDVGRGTHRYVAARYTFRRLFLAGLTALLADAVGFAVLMVIDIPVIRELAMTASIGVAVLIFTNLVLLPVMLSYVGVSPVAAERALQAERREFGQAKGMSRIWDVLDKFTERRWALATLVCSFVLAAVGLAVSANLKIGDLDAGAPELRPESRYNRDNAYITGNYGLSSDVFAVIVKTPPEGMSAFETLIEEDRLEQALRALPAVQTTTSAASLARFATYGNNEGNPKWLTIVRDPAVTTQATYDLRTNNPEYFNRDGSAGTVVAYLRDHKATTLDEVVAVTEQFISEHSTPERQFLLAAGTAGIEAATNSSVAYANHRMLLMVYGAVIILCLITFRNWRAAVVAVVPLVLTSILCEALMVVLGIGVKVATLPVVALGVGIGVDYALYLLSVQLGQQRAGVPLREAYRNAVVFTGKVVALIGVTLGAGVVTWAWSPIKFQADMGILLTFMFLWNMIGALLLIPALSHFLLQTNTLTRTPELDEADDTSSEVKAEGAASTQAVISRTTAVLQ
ncbi:MAG: MMPL family transporter [Pseudomonas sp.]|uniref:efflux RND transporter permease subunit n=1 Tax=Pseudomonas sp. TaxID=306 RepID=UPI0039829D55